MPSISQLSEISLAFSTSKDDSPMAVAGTQSEIFVAVSRNSIASYVVSPSPRIRWTQSVSPATMLTCVDRGLLGSTEVVAYGLNERKKTLVKVVGTVEEEDKIDLTHEVASSVRFVKIIDQLCICVLEDSSIEAFPLGESNSWSSKSKSNRSFVHAEFLSPEYLERTGINSGLGGLVIVSQKQGGKRESLEVKVVVLETSRAVEILFKDIVGGGSDSQFAVHENYLYRFTSGDGKLEVYDLNNSMSREDVVLTKAGPTGKESSIVSVGQTVLVHHDKDLYLVDAKHQTLLATRQLETPITLLKHFEGRNGHTVVGVKSNSKTSSVIVELVVDPGKGTLLESLGKGIHGTQNAKEWKFALSDIVITTKTGSLKDYNSEIETRLQAAKTSTMEFLKKLKDTRTLKDIEAFEKHIFDYFKISGYSQDDSPVYDADKDRLVDRDVIIEILSLVCPGLDLTQSLSDNGQPRLAATLDSKFIPENALIYLLTHPLFPTSQFPHLLGTLASYPRLYRQAIVTAPGMSINNLITALDHPDDEIFRDAVSRITEEFSQEQITKGIKAQYTSTKDNAKVIATAKRLVRLDVGWTIVPCLVDAGGLFLWDESFVNSVIERVGSRIDSLESTIEIMTLIDEVIHKIDPASDPTSVNKTSKKELKKLTKKRPPAEQETSVLGFGPRDVHTSMARLPAYTVEKLEL